MRITRGRGTLVITTALAAVVGLASSAAAVASNTTVTATPQTTTAGSLVQLHASVGCQSDPGGGLGVTFFDGGNLLATVPVTASGQADFSTTFTVGTHTITASYNGNETCDASSSTTTVEATTAPTPPSTTPGFCLLACGGLINFTTGNISNYIS
ncbi:Ig-like domain-containing protein [Streptomyces sp. NBC_01431]|uniref:Ig-like domain-containing protein n=1 Tax=Streptomyces sp. NBC_01431 TaxID=2903863 RepID=UPI002E37163E|nr:Ig-like domain-containing protein [Streptomyces sp. NBC_01431]